MRVVYKVILGIVCLVWFCGLIIFLNKIPIYQPQVNNIADAAIVLTGGDKRIEEGVKILQEHKVKKMFITGVNQRIRNKKEIPYIEELNKVHNIEIGREALTTNGNALEAKEWIQQNNIKTIKLVTANYHMPRSVLEFKHHLPDISIESHPVFPDKFDISKWWYDKNTLTLVLKEYTKYIYVLCYITIQNKSLKII